MSVLQFDIERINHLKDILLRIHYGEKHTDIYEGFQEVFSKADAITILPDIYEVKSGDFGVTNEDIMNLFDIFYHLNGEPLSKLNVPDSKHAVSAIDIFLHENKAFQLTLQQIHELLESNTDNEELMGLMSLLGEFYHHFNRKEKLFFPILERYGYYTLTRTMWGDDDRIRTLYKGTKTMMQKFDSIDINYIKKAFVGLESKMKDMIFQEEAFLLPILVANFTDKDWLAVTIESDAYGYSLVDMEEHEVPPIENMERSFPDDGRHLPFGGGFLTLQEANYILNNLPLELTFIDKNGVFKYFNEITTASEMMFVRTPSSIGRHVANCHPPKSMSKVMRLIRDLKSQKRTSENMWFKKKDKFVHITYKGVYNERDEFLGILEYVQDIQPFFNLPREVKKELSALDE
ncbi:PAS domain-containing protein [Oceanobacillus sp. CAU 1775]